MTKSLRRIGLWWLIWIIFSIVFVDYLPQHPHITYEVLIAPLVLLITLVAYPSELFGQVIPTGLLPGVGFWVVTVLLYFYPKKKNEDGVVKK